MPDRGDGAPESNHPLNVADALSYLDAVKAQFWDRPEVYNHFLDIMKDFKNQVIGTSAAIQRVSQLFHGNPSLIRGFDMFLPVVYHINISHSDHTITGTSIPNTDDSHGEHSRIALDIPGFGPNIEHPLPFPVGSGPGSRSPTPLYHVPHPQQVPSQAPFGGGNPNLPQTQTKASASFLGSLNSSSSHAPEKPQAPSGESNHAIQYLNKIKARYTDDLSTYKQFLDILQAYQKDQMLIQESYVRVQHLFRDAPDLLDEFKMFLPEMAGGFPHHPSSAPWPMDERPLKKIRL
ncbi:paired amphipathic helix [Roridomyces roridus]|uniref:Paired amphipathic helix n=1 Tax=Roridomyces roridus TaxID=1738132 RepID=A0AAD7CID5_9AGAR|nr:paired amphipathic helix [Roridomyces roridus]